MKILDKYEYGAMRALNNVRVWWNARGVFQAAKDSASRFGDLRPKAWPEANIGFFCSTSIGCFLFDQSTTPARPAFATN